MSLFRRATSARRPAVRAVTTMSTALALVASSLVLATPAAAYSSHHSSSAPRISFAFFDNGAQSGSEFNTTAGLVISVNRATSVARSVRVRTGGGTADPADEYTSIDQRVSIPAGKTTVGLRIPIGAVGEDEPTKYFFVALSSPSSGARLGLVRVARVAIYPWGGSPPLGGATDRIHDFESGVPDDVAAFSSRVAVRPRLTTLRSAAPNTLPENRALAVQVDRKPRSTDALGFRQVHESWDLEPSAYGPTLSFRGTGTGGRIAFVLRNGSKVFEYSVVDDSTGWRSMDLSFDDFRLRSNPSSDERYNPDDFTGYEIRLTGVSAGRYLFDNPSLVYIF